MEKLKETDFYKDGKKYYENIAMGFNSSANKINEIVDWINKATQVVPGLLYVESQLKVPEKDIDKKTPIKLGGKCLKCNSNYCACLERQPDGSWKDDIDKKLEEVLDGIYCEDGYTKKEALNKIKEIYGI